MVEGGKFLQEGEGRCKDRGNQIQAKGRTSQTLGQNRWLERNRVAGVERKSIANLRRLEFEVMFPLCMVMKSHSLLESQFFIWCHPCESLEFFQPGKACDVKRQGNGNQWVTTGLDGEKIKVQEAGI